MSISKLTVGSLFAGIGGIELGLEWTGGFQTVWQVENDEYAKRVLQKHWPEVKRWGDVATFPPDAKCLRCDSANKPQSESNREAIKTTSLQGAGAGDGFATEHDRQLGEGLGVWNADLICGGFPCQDISYAGKGAGLKGARSGLWTEFARVVRTLRPRYVLVENVGALLTRGIDSVLGTLVSLGYDAEWNCIPAAAVGAPHIRDRVFIVGFCRNPNTMRCLGNSGKKRKVQDENTDTNGICEDVSNAVQPECEPRAGGRGVRQGDTDVADASQLFGNGGDHNGKRGCRQIPQPGNGVEKTRPIGSWWSTEPNVGRVAHGVPSRMDRLRCLGNAVVPQVAQYVGYRILEMERENQNE